MNQNNRITLLEKIGYSLGDVAINVLLQILAVLLLKNVSDLIGLAAAACVAMAYVFILILSRWSMSPYFNKNRPAAIRIGMSTLLGSRSLRVIVVVTLLVYISLSMRCAVISFYFHDYVDRQSLSAWLNGWGFAVDRELAYAVGLTFFLFVSAIIQIVAMVVYSVNRHKGLSEKVLFGILLILTAFSLALFYVAQPDDIGLMFLLCIISSLTYAPTITILWNIVCDVSYVIEYSSNQNVTGFSFSAIAFALKAGIALGMAFAGLILMASGYVSESYIIQSWTVLQGIRWACSIFPALFILAGVIILFKYPINGR